MRKVLLLTTICSVLALNVYAKETEITIYNQNLALIKKNAEMALQKGVNEIVFDEVAEQMRPESAFIYGDGIRVLEQNYDYAGINYMTLLNANIGKEVKTVREDSKTGANIFEKAILVAVDGATPVLKFDYGIETQFGGRVLFNEIPSTLNSTPVLMAKVEADQTESKNLGLAYLTSGFDWQANYIAKVNNSETLSLLGRVAISNNSGSGYENIKVNLIAGDVNVVRNIMQPRMMGVSKGMMLMANDLDNSEAVIDKPESMDSYYIYQIPEKTNLKNGQMKQVSFINAGEVKYQKEAVLQSYIHLGQEKNSFKDVHPQVIYHFVNQKEDGLGMPLPQGKISFYAPDGKGSLQFIGENMIDHKAEGQKVSLPLGRFFDVYGKGEIESLNKVSEKQIQRAGQKCPALSTVYHYNLNYELTSKSKDVVHFVLKQVVPTSAKILKETIKGNWGEGNVYEWKFDLAPMETKDIKVEIENQTERLDCSLINL